MKKLVVNIKFFLVLLVGVSGCYEFEYTPSLGGSGGGPFEYHPLGESAYRPTFFIDSLFQSGNSDVRIWAHILYDTLLVIESLTTSTHYHGQPMGEGYDVVKTAPDTIDFTTLTDSTSVNGRKEWIYKYAVNIDSLKRGISYWFCTSNRYTEFTAGYGWVAWDDTCTESLFELK